MNKEELFEKTNELDEITIIIPTDDGPVGINYLRKQEVFELIEQIGEPQKPVVPKFVAEWLDTLDEHGLFGLDYDIVDESVQDWVYENYDCNAKKLHLAYLYGYTVEKEKLYTVEIPDPNSYCDYRYLSRNDNGICIDASNNPNWKQNKKNQFTESEIKQDFDFLWQFAKPVEDE